MCFLTVDEPVSNKTPEAVWGIVCDNAAAILNRLVKKDRSSEVKLSIYCCTLWCSPMVMGWKWAKGQCCRDKRLKWGSSGEWMVSALEIGLRSLDIGEELKEELLPFGNERSQLRWFRYLMRMPSGLIPLEVFWRDYITYPTCHGSTSAPKEGSIARRRETWNSCCPCNWFCIKWRSNVWWMAFDAITRFSSWFWGYITYMFILIDTVCCNNMTLDKENNSGQQAIVSQFPVMLEVKYIKVQSCFF